MLSSEAEDEIRRLKYDMVISLSAQRGLFWQLIQEVRKRCAIEPAVRVPSSELAGPVDHEFPLRAPNPYLPANGPDPYEQPEAQWEFVARWHAELGAIYRRMVPEESPARMSLWDWESFLAVCVLHDPPDDALLEFVAVGGPEPETYYGGRFPEDFDPDELPRMLAPPIKTLQDLRESPDWARDCLLDWLGAILDSSGLNPGELLSLIERHDPGAWQRYHEKRERDSRRHFIEVTSTMSWDDLKNAFSVYRASQEGRPASSRPPRDRLIAFQCTILHDRHKRTYRELVDRYGFGSLDAAKNYVKLGREILEEI